MIVIALTSVSLATKKRILTVCVKLFMEKGYKKTTLAEIVEKANVSYSSFQNIFRAKDGVLTELVEFMFLNQFAAARSAAEERIPPICVYAVETAIHRSIHPERSFGIYFPRNGKRDTAYFLVIFAGTHLP